MAWIGLWHFDDTGSSTVVDVSGNGFDITLTGFNGAQVDSAGVLDGGALSKSAVGTVPLPAGLLAVAETDDRTIMFDAAAQRSVWWVRFEDTGLGTGVWGTLSLDEANMVARARSQANGNPSPAAPTIGAIVTGTRHNYAITYKRSTGVLSYYYDGTLVGTSTHAAGTALFVGADQINIAEWGTSGAAMDNLRIANHCADAAEIAALAGAPVSASPAFEGTVTLAATAALNVSGQRSAVGATSLTATAGLTSAGVRSAAGTTPLVASTTLLKSGVSHRSGTVTLAASAVLRVGPATDDRDITVTAALAPQGRITAALGGRRWTATLGEQP
jgi:hypothetical protein